MKPTIYIDHIKETDEPIEQGCIVTNGVITGTVSAFTPGGDHLSMIILEDKSFQRACYCKWMINVASVRRIKAVIKIK